MQAFTALTASFTPFTLANFTQSIMVNLTNVNNTNQQPQGEPFASACACHPVCTHVGPCNLCLNPFMGADLAPSALCIAAPQWPFRAPHDACSYLLVGAGTSYAVIVDSSGNTIGNFTLVATGINPNTLALTLPSTFNATALLQTGSYTETITYYPTSNFTQPSPLVIQFQITVGSAHECPLSPALMLNKRSCMRHQSLRLSLWSIVGKFIQSCLLSCTRCRTRDWSLPLSPESPHDASPPQPHWHCSPETAAIPLSWCQELPC